MTGYCASVNNSGVGTGGQGGQLPPDNMYVSYLNILSLN